MDNKATIIIKGICVNNYVNVFLPKKESKRY